MEIQITKQEQQPLFHTTKVEASITFQGATPTRKAVVAAVAKAMKAKQELIIVKKVATSYGNQEAKVTAYVYDDRKALEALERKVVLEKHAFAEEQKEEAPAEAPKEAAAEEKKEESAAEEKPAEEKAAPAEKKGDA